MTVTEDDRQAKRLLGLIAPNEGELIVVGKSRHTVTNYVDRAERFLRRIAKSGA
jgi:hypothetical protein